MALNLLKKKVKRTMIIKSRRRTEILAEIGICVLPVRRAAPRQKRCGEKSIKGYPMIRAMGVAMLSWLVCGVALAEDLVQIRVDKSGLQSLTYRGVEYVDPVGAGVVGFSDAEATPQAASKDDAGVFVTTPTSVTVNGTTVTQTYPWGTFVVVYEAKGSDLTVTATLRNTSKTGLKGWRANVLQLNDRIVFRGGGGTFGFSPEMQWSYYYEQAAGAKDPYEHLTQQQPHVYWWVDRATPFEAVPVKVMFADLTGTFDTGVNRLKTDKGDRWPVFVAARAWEMAPPGQIQENKVKVAIRFRDKAPDDVAVVDELRRRIQSIEQQIATAQATLKEMTENMKLDLEETEKVLDAEQVLAARQAELAEAQNLQRSAGVGAMPSAIEVCADGYEAWGRYNSRQMTWTDRRSIGAYFGCRDALLSPTNPNGWFKDPTVDTTTPEGRSAFAARLLDEIDASIDVLRQAGAQGVIWWDLEGQRYPQPLTYIGDPRVLDPAHPHHKAFAPELETPVEYKGETIPVVDACFEKWKDAGFSTGVTIRPQHLTYASPVSEDQARSRVEAAQQRIKAAQVKLNKVRESIDAIFDSKRPVEVAELELKQSQMELSRALNNLEKAKLGAIPNGQSHKNGHTASLPKAKYAHERWGCTLFYVDTISAPFGYWAIDKAARALPDCLFMPEWATPRTYRCSAQSSYTPMTGYTRGVPPELQAAWPDAFCVMCRLDYNNESAMKNLLIAVQRGNLPVFDW